MIILRLKHRLYSIARICARISRFFINAYRYHWVATPAAAVAAITSTFGAAAVMLLVSPVFHSVLGSTQAIIANAIFAPLLAYAVYLAVYYSGMFLKERVTMTDPAGHLDREKLQRWWRVVKYDYVAHVPTDIYLITLAGIMQAALEKNGTPIFWAVVTSQFVDDFITFLKEPTIWNGAKEIVAWENRENTTLKTSIISKFARKV